MSMSTKRIRKAVVPVAGFGTRVLPATKAVAKEMLPVFDRPVLQYVVDEAFAAGIEHIIFVTGRNKGAIEDYFDSAYELEHALSIKGKTDLLAELRAIAPTPGAASFVRQQAPLGLGHAVWCARDIVGEEAFALLLPDMIMAPAPGAPSCLEGLMAVYGREGGNVIGLSHVDPAQAHNYGIVALGATKTIGMEITGMVEKPAAGSAPSSLYINGRYLLQPEIFTILAGQSAGAGGEIQITDAMVQLLADQPFHGFAFEGRVHDCGDKIGYLRAVAAMALSHDRLGAEARAALLEELGVG